MSDQRRLQIFISSPSDVRPERLVAQRIIERLDREFSYHFRIEPILWEREPLIATQHFQASITPPHETDIVVVILWSRLGVLLPVEKYPGAITGRPVTGTEWEFEDAVASYRTRKLPDLLLYRKRAQIPAFLDDDSVLESQRQQKRLLEDFVQRWFVDTNAGTFKAASREFAAAAEFEDLLETHLRDLLLERLKGETVQGGIRWPGSPFRGLESFEAQHTQIFFGRTRARNELRELLARRVAADCPSFVLVLGASGSGKSSLVKAGLLPDLKLPGIIGRVALCRHAVFRPADAPGDPVDGLAAAILSPAALPELAAPPLSCPRERLATLLRAAPEQVALPIEQGLAVAGAAAQLTEHAEARLLLVVDQLEELFTLDGLQPTDRSAFVAALVGLARSGFVWIVGTMRSDFFDRLETLPALARLSAEGRYLLTPPDAAELGQIIRQPAREAGLRFEVDRVGGVALDDRLLQAAGQAAAGLPLLEFTLDQLWQRRTERGQLTFAAYEELGGLEGALGRRAEEEFTKLPTEVQLALPDVLRALATAGQGRRAIVTARPALLSSFPLNSPRRHLVEAFLSPQARLLVADGDDEGSRVRVAHEALLTRWDRAREILVRDRADLQIRARLEENAALWRDAAEESRDDLLLHAGLPLAQAQDLLKRRRDALDSAVIAYIQASADAVQASERRERRRLQTAVAVFAALMLLAVAGAGFAYLQTQKAEQQRNAAERQTQLATARQLAAQAQVGVVRTPHNLLLALESISISQKIGAFSPTASRQLLDDLLNATGGIPLEHAAPVAAVAFSPDDRWLAAASAGVVQLWDMQAPRTAPVILARQNIVNALAFSPDGRTLAIVGDDTGVRLSDMAAADRAGSARILETHSAHLAGVAFSSNGRWLATASRDKDAQMWDLTATDSATATSILPHDKGANTLAFSPDNRWLATGSSDGTVRMWNLLSLNPSTRPIFLRVDADVRKVAFSPDSQWLVTGDTESYTVVLMRVTAPQQRFLLRVNQWATAVAFSPDGRWLATPSQYDTRLWDLNKPDPSSEPLILPGHKNAILDLAFSPDGKWFATASADYTVQLWNVVDRFTAPTVLRGHEGGISGLAFSHDSRHLATACADGTVRLWTTVSPAAEPLMLRTLGGASEKLHVWDIRAVDSPEAPRVLGDKLEPNAGSAFSPDGQWIATIHAPFGVTVDSVDLWKLSTPSPTYYRVRHPGGIWAAPVFSPDGRWLATGGVHDPTVRLWDLKSPDPQSNSRLLQGHKGPVRSLAFSADGRFLVSGARDGFAFVWDLTADPLLPPKKLRGGDINAVAISADGRRVVTGSWEPDYDARIWDLSSPFSSSNPVKLTFEGRLADVAISPDGRWIAAGSWDFTTQLLDLSKPGSKPFVLKGHTARTLSVAFSPDSQWLATGNEDQTARLWNLAAADPSLDSTVLQAPYRVGNASFSPDGRWLALIPTVYLTNPFSPDGSRFVSSGTETRLYHVRLEDLIALACRTAGRNLTKSEWKLSFGDQPYRKTCSQFP
jgi:WD40 repeat protein